MARLDPYQSPFTLALPSARSPFPQDLTRHHPLPHLPPMVKPPSHTPHPPDIEPEEERPTKKSKTRAPRKNPKGPDQFRPFRKAVAGRPTNYDDSFCDRVMYAGAHGLSFAQISHDLGATRSSLCDWAEGHPAFSAALAQARESALAWWEAQGQKGLWEGKDFNDRVLKFVMTNQFRDDYKERVEISGTLAKIDFTRLNDEQLAAIAGGEHPYTVLAPRREVLTAGDAAPGAPQERDQRGSYVKAVDVAQATESENVVGTTIREEDEHGQDLSNGQDGAAQPAPEDQPKDLSGDD